MRLVAASLLLLVAASPALAQSSAAYQAVLVVQEGEKEIGREEVSVRADQQPDAGRTLLVTSRYPHVNPAVQLTLQFDGGDGGELGKFVLEGTTPEGPTLVYAIGSGARLIVRTKAGGAESGRELPGGPNVVLLDPNIYALYVGVARQATPAGARLTAVFPRTGRRASIVARREPGERGAASRIVLTGDIAGTLSIDADGQLERAEFPASRTVVTRQAR